MKRILERKRRELEEWLKTLPQYADLGPDTDRMSGGQEKKYRETLAILKFLDELLGGPCWHEVKEKVSEGYWRCTACGGMWDHFSSAKEEPQFTTHEQVGKDLQRKLEAQVTR